MLVNDISVNVVSADNYPQLEEKIMDILRDLRSFEGKYKIIDIKYQESEKYMSAMIIHECLDGKQDK